MCFVNVLRPLDPEGGRDKDTEEKGGVEERFGEGGCWGRGSVSRYRRHVLRRIDKRTA